MCKREFRHDGFKNAAPKGIQTREQPHQQKDCSWSSWHILLKLWNPVSKDFCLFLDGHSKHTKYTESLHIARESGATMASTSGHTTHWLSFGPSAHTTQKKLRSGYVPMLGDASIRQKCQWLLVTRTQKQLLWPSSQSLLVYRDTAITQRCKTISFLLWRILLELTLYNLFRLSYKMKQEKVRPLHGEQEIEIQPCQCPRSKLLLPAVLRRNFHPKCLRRQLDQLPLLTDPYFKRLGTKQGISLALEM
jgi:hypothetical protein